jgi:pimeloyl-ACP methyl ester carboxylesterase
MIDQKEKVMLGGFAQTIHIIGQNQANPVILVLHGGPGISNRDSVVYGYRSLQESYTLVAWDQRGTAGSYHGIDTATLTLDQMVNDAHELVLYLCRKLGKDKIVILGGSWGTELGTYLCNRYPEHIGAYIGFGQVVNGVKNEDLSYAFAMEQAVKAGDEKSIAILKRVGPPVDGQYTPCLKGMLAQRRIMKKYGGHSTKKGGYWKNTVKPLLLSKEFTIADKWGLIRGYKLVLNTMWPHITQYDFTTQCNSFECPYYIFQGALDRNTPAALVQQFYDAIKAPDKALVWFEHSAHGPISEEPDKFESELKARLSKLDLR